MKKQITILTSFVLASVISMPSVQASSSIILEGTVLDQQSNPLPSAEIKLLGETTTTNVNGQFSLGNLPRQNGLLEIKRPGYHTELIPVYLFYPENVLQKEIEPIWLAPKPANEIRFLFGGDTSFGRRYLKPKEVTPRDQIPQDDPNALILASQPLPGSQAVADYIRPYYLEADWGVLNLETPLTRNPSTPHWEKNYAYFTLPESAPALQWLGVDYVSLGNNHVYDYLDIGVVDTIATLNAINLPHSGAGLNPEEAFQAYRTMIKGTPYAFLSMTSVSGSQHSISYVAEQTHGGAADLRDKERLYNATQRELKASYIPILQLHGGQEYTFEPTKRFQKHIQSAVDSGAKLVIGHHPHVAQGIGKINGIITVHSLGNLMFDQARLETMLGLLVRIDMQTDIVTNVRFLPIYIEDYVPKPLTGYLANILLRRVNEFSHNYGALVYPYNQQGWVAFHDEAQPQTVERTLELDVEIPDSGMTIVDLRKLTKSTESLLKVHSITPALKVRLGRDILYFGDFEDWDLDQEILEAARWDTTKASSQVCSFAYWGNGAVCSTRTSTNKSDSVIPFRQRTRIMGTGTSNPNKELSLFGYVSGNNAGPIRIVTRYYASLGDKIFGEEDSFLHPGGTFAWQPIIADLQMPPDETDIADVANNPRAIRYFIRHSPPLNGEGLAIFDEFAAINWEEVLDIVSPQEVITPHARDFLRVEGEPGKYLLSLTFMAYQPPPVTRSFISLDLKANGQDILQTDSQTKISVTASLNHNSDHQETFDWWITANTDFGMFSYVYPDGWVAGEQRAISSPLLNFPPLVISEGPLPQGFYTVSFCISKNAESLCIGKDRMTISID